MEGPPPSDPSVLDNIAGSGEASRAAAPPAEAPASRPTPQARPTPTVSAPAPRQGGPHPLLSRQARSPPPAEKPAPIIDLFGDDSSHPAPASKPTSPPTAPAHARHPSAAKAASPPATQPAQQPQSNIFDLDFKAPTPPAQKQQSSKSDIMSLFSQAPALQQPGGFSNQNSSQNQFGSWNGGVTNSQPSQGQATTTAVPTWGGGFGDQAAWGAPAQAQAQQQGWGGPQQAQPQQGWGSPQAAQQQGWGQQQPQGQQSASANPWGADPWAQPTAQAQPAQKKDDRDPFANIWG